MGLLWDSVVWIGSGLQNPLDSKGRLREPPDPVAKSHVWLETQIEMKSISAKTDAGRDEARDTAQARYVNGQDVPLSWRRDGVGGHDLQFAGVGVAPEDGVRGQRVVALDWDVGWRGCASADRRRHRKAKEGPGARDAGERPDAPVVVERAAGLIDFRDEVVSQHCESSCALAPEGRLAQQLELVTLFFP